MALALEELKAERRKALGKYIRSERRRKGPNLKQVSQKLAEHGYGLSASQLSRIETGLAPANTDDLTELFALLDVPWPQLFGFQDKSGETSPSHFLVHLRIQGNDCLATAEKLV